MDKAKKGKKEQDSNDILGGTLNILGFKLDLGEMLNSPESLTSRLDELRETLKAAGGKEVLSDGEWSRGGMSVTGHVRVRGLQGDQEFHVGTMGKPHVGAMGKPGRRAAPQATPEPPDVLEPPVDVFYEGQQVTIVADVPGVSQEDLELTVEGKVFHLSTKSTARRSYQKELLLDSEVDPDSMQASCHNGVLQVRFNRR